MLYMLSILFRSKDAVSGITKSWANICFFVQFTIKVTDKDFDITSIYKEVCELEKSRIPEFETEIIRSYNTSKKCFVEIPEDDRDSLQLFAFICNLSFDIYVKKQIVEKLLDNFPDLLHSEKKNSNKDSKKKK